MVLIIDPYGQSERLRNAMLKPRYNMSGKAAEKPDHKEMLNILYTKQKLNAEVLDLTVVEMGGDWKKIAKMYELSQNLAGTLARLNVLIAGKTTQNPRGAQ